MAADGRRPGGGRIRIEPDSAALLLALLRSARRDTMRARRAAIEAGNDVQKREAGRQSALIDRVIQEIQWTQIEMGWP